MARAWGRTLVHSFSHETKDAPISRNSIMRWTAVAFIGMNSSAWRRSESTFDIRTLSVCDNSFASAKCRGSAASSEGRRGPVPDVGKRSRSISCDPCSPDCERGVLASGVSGI